ncbi:MAG TPA: FAD-dependent oxidoreductase [Dermatophilaceae bacterium]|nr:FAD-dependent oxidoreductase [Dermatophilaceae bacterium]
MRTIIIGGVAGGMSAATRLRRLDESAEIIVLERSGYVSFANCGLPYHVGGVIEKRGALLLQNPGSLKRRFGIDVRVRHEVTAIDPAAREVSVTDLRTGAHSTLRYDSLVLSPGGRPVRPPIPGIERALSLRDIEDTDAMVAAVGPADTAVVVGGGFIGVEMAENLVHRGLRVTLVEATDQVMAPLDPELAALVHTRLREHGVTLVLGASVSAIGADTATLSDGSVVQADLVVAAIGVRPETSLALGAGLELGPRGGILVDDQLRTSDPAIYAVGDAVEKRDALDDSQALVPLANTANRQGRVVADIIAGHGGSDRPVLGTAVVGVFGLTVATTGWNEKRLRAAGTPYRAIHTHPANHAGYYPGAEPISLKLLFDPVSTMILGAQAVGGAGAEKRIDVIATAMAGGLTAPALADLELAYAPQYSSAKDPVNMLGWVARNMTEGLVNTVQWHEVAGRVAGGATVVDVRTAPEYAAGHIPGSVNVPVDDLRGRLGDLPDGELLVVCAVGIRGYLAARTLAQQGRAVANVDGGYLTWAASPAADATRR